MEVDVLLERVRDRLRAPASCGVPGVDVLVADALRPGKLLRPDLVVHSAAAVAPDCAADPEIENCVVAGALAVELLHVATLVHDDIIDGAALRRGRPSVVAAGGAATAIVVGDLLLARGVVAAVESAAPAAGVWARALERMAAGQLREELLCVLPSVEAHAEYVALKTAALFEASAEIGALAARAQPEVVESHARFGHHFGMAFQHVDDMLDTIGDPVRMGKPVGADADNGVVTAVALLDVDGSTEAVADLVVSELAAAQAVVARCPGGAELGTWAARSLLRTLEVGLGEGGRRRAHHLTTALRASA